MRSLPIGAAERDITDGGNVVSMAGAVIIPRDVIEQLCGEPELLALMVLFVSRARYTPGKAAKGADLMPGQLAIGKRAIASQFKWTESKAYRALNRLQDRNLIELSANRDGTVVTLCNSERYRQFDKQRRTIIETKVNCQRTEIVSKSNQNRTPTEKGLKKQAPPPPTPSALESPDRSAWEGVEEELANLGMVKASTAVAAAQARGLTLGDAWSLITEWRKNKGAWDKGALFGRLTGDLNDWPHAAESFQREKQRQTTARSHEAIVAERIAGEDRREAEKRRRMELEARWGGVIEALSNEQVIAALDDDLLVGMYRRKGLCPSVRERLGEAFELQEAVA